MEIQLNVQDPLVMFPSFLLQFLLLPWITKTLDKNSLTKSTRLYKKGHFTKEHLKDYDVILVQASWCIY